MDFREIKEMCKHAAPGICCPLNFKNCNADNCPFVFKEDVDVCQWCCPVVDSLEEKNRRAITDFENANIARKELEKNIKGIQQDYSNALQQFKIMKNELIEIVNGSINLITNALYDLRDKLKESCNRLEP